jgi:ribonuclease G
MTRSIIVINVDIRETRVALVEGGVIAELQVERASHLSTVGNVVLGKVTRVLPGMQAAFIDVGQERSAFLHVEDLIRPDDFELYLTGGADDQDQSFRGTGARKATHLRVGDDEDEDGEEGAEEADGPGGQGLNGTHPGDEEVALRGKSGSGAESLEDDEDVESGPDDEESSARASAEEEDDERDDDAGEEDTGEEDAGEEDAGEEEDEDESSDDDDSEDADSDDLAEELSAHEADADDDDDVDVDVEAAGAGGADVEDLDDDDVDEVEDVAADADEDFAARGSGPLDSSIPLAAAVLDSAAPVDRVAPVDHVTARDSSAPVDHEAPVDRVAPLGARRAVAEGGAAESRRTRGDRRGNRGDRGNHVAREPAVVPGALVGRERSRPEAAATESGSERDRGRNRQRGRGGQRSRRGRRGNGAPEAKPSFDRRVVRGSKPTGSRHSEGTPARVSRSVPITEVVKEGDEVVVQISKEPIGTKGARVTSHVSLPGRYVVYLPTVDHLGISKRIGSARERARLRQVMESLKPARGGLIVRTVAEGLTKKQLKADVGYLIRVWAEVCKRRDGAKPAEVLYTELDLVLKVARDLFTDEVKSIVIDDRDQYARLVRFVEMFLPERAKDIELYTGSEPIFDAYGIEDEIGRALSRKVPLPSGGSLIVDQAEALTAIDVNTGRYVGKGSRDLEETALKTNLEAVEEIAYQLRFRNIGGLVILDLIDMEKHSNREKVWRALEAALVKDKAKTTLNRISELGLIEMTRKRTRESLGRMLHEPCFYCDGTGQIQSKATIAYEILRQIGRERSSLPGYSVVVNAHPAIVDFLKTEDRGALEEAERRYARRIELAQRTEYHIEQYDLQGK